MQKDFLYYIYNTKLGRLLLRILKTRIISKIVGLFLSSWASKFLIKPFIKKNKINMMEYERTNYKSFNDFFTRKIKSEYRPISQNKNDFISPCDGYLSIYKIDNGLVIPVKQSKYSIASLLKNEKQACKYKNGICLVIRLSPSNYHRYCYIDNGTKKSNKYIKGFLHTVRPVALENTSVFTENSREITVLETKNFGSVTEVEVGAMLVGKIRNYHGKYTYQKGEEKGMFLFGGSTIILLVEKDKIKFKDIFWKNTEKNIETPVIMGEVLGKK